ncbi:MAG: hypothetical protein ACT4QF_15715 [Sporichthyaceae bacterium]
MVIEGPYGRLNPARHTGGKVVMIAGGIGIAPLLALLEDLAYPRGGAVLLYRASARADLVFEAEIAELDATRGLQVHYLLGPRGSAEATWLPDGGASASESLLAMVPDLPRCDVFVCGPDPWADAVCASAVTAGLPEWRLHRERFSW